MTTMTARGRGVFVGRTHEPSSRTHRLIRHRLIRAWWRGLLGRRRTASGWDDMDEVRDQIGAHIRQEAAEHSLLGSIR